MSPGSASRTFPSAASPAPPGDVHLLGPGSGPGEAGGGQGGGQGGDWGRWGTAGGMGRGARWAVGERGWAVGAEHGDSPLLPPADEAASLLESSYGCAFSIAVAIHPCTFFYHCTYPSLRPPALFYPHTHPSVHPSPPDISPSPSGAGGDGQSPGQAGTCSLLGSPGSQQPRGQVTAGVTDCLPKFSNKTPIRAIYRAGSNLWRPVLRSVIKHWSNNTLQDGLQDT